MPNFNFNRSGKGVKELGDQLGKNPNSFKAQAHHLIPVGAFLRGARGVLERERAYVSVG